MSGSFILLRFLLQVFILVPSSPTCHCWGSCEAVLYFSAVCDGLIAANLPFRPRGSQHETSHPTAQPPNHPTTQPRPAFQVFGLLVAMLDAQGRHGEMEEVARRRLEDLEALEGRADETEVCLWGHENARVSRGLIYDLCASSLCIHVTALP